MKGIGGELGEMNIMLKQDAKLVGQRPYKLNLKHKEKLKEELGIMLEDGIIQPVAKSQ
jgi:hypothetical protein